MSFTDIFIKRPVLAMVISIMILAMGLRSMNALPVMQYPFTENAIITVTTTYTGANPDVVAGFITTPLENSIAQANGIDYMTSASTPGTSTITINLLLNYDPLKALSEVTAKVNAVLNQLPANSQQPVITVSVGESISSMYLSFYSDELSINEIADYLLRVVQPKLQAIDGVQEAEIIGNQNFALRTWLDPVKLAGYGISPAQVGSALGNNNFISAAGRTDGKMFIQNLTTSTDLTKVDQFQQMVIKAENGAIVRLKDLSKTNLGEQNYNSSVRYNDHNSGYIGIIVSPSANLLTVLKKIKKEFSIIQSELPASLKAAISYDASLFIDASIYEVLIALLEAFIIVALVIFIFLGSIRSVIIPIIAIPLSIIGTFWIMLMLGYSINLLTLLALVLGIGLVVDDAIIMVENIQRHINEGKTKVEAALIGARELAIPIIAIALVLFAVYAPIGFMGGLTGALFSEFAFTLVAAVVISTVVALTLSPMMCSKFLKKEQNERKNKLMSYVDRFFLSLEKKYKKALVNTLRAIPVVVVFALIIFISNYFLFVTSESELAPQEDQGIIMASVTAAANASLQQTQLYSDEVNRIYTSFPEMLSIFQLDGLSGLNTSLVGIVLTPWNERTRTSNQLQPIMQKKFNTIAGAKVAAYQKASLPGGSSGLPIQFVINTTKNFNELNQAIQPILEQAESSGLFSYIDPDLKIDQLQTQIVLDRDKVAQLGLTMRDIGDVLGSALSEGYINYFNYDGRSYQVIPQVQRDTRTNTEQILNYYINSSTGTSVPLSTVARLEPQVVPESINHFQQLNSATISAIAAPGVSMAKALETLAQIAKDNLAQEYYVDYAAQSRQFMQEGTSLIGTFFFALILIFLALAALFESFRDPFIVLISVPLSVCGAMIFVSLGIGEASLNIYSEVGLVTLIGLISKHGILIVQFANDLQAAGQKKLDAIRTAAAIRLRPILMTTAAMVLGVIPLILATGAGAASRYNIGLVIATGISIGTLFTLFVLPSMYLLLAQDHRKNRQQEVASSIKYTAS
ncbi:efflux RND transporter permease subunit [Legionella sp. km772]|uniref:efflux RND transporter permease subunit n=1 Tax=Legionella sp. km772 TaxID=2498111 RepID=UPI000F8CE649|nr:efflux RND transporter permease subunit [Legionella sp. km772]RUR09167.1 multidrug efflux protein [Legionella sp. km772]